MYTITRSVTKEVNEFDFSKFHVGDLIAIKNRNHNFFSDEKNWKDCTAFDLDGTIAFFIILGIDKDSLVVSSGEGQYTFSPNNFLMPWKDQGQTEPDYEIVSYISKSNIENKMLN